jgi:ethanolaminephosphotransferase
MPSCGGHGLAGVMLYGNGYFGILEANYALATVHFISAALGAHFWTDMLGFWFPRLPARLHMVPVVMAVFYAAVVFMLIQMVGQVARVYRGTATMDASERGHKCLGALPATQHLLYMTVFLALAYLYLMQPPHGGVFHSRALLLYVAVSYSTIATQLIMAHMAKEAWRPAWTPFVGLVAGAVNSKLEFVHSEALAYTLGAVVLVTYLHYVVCVCKQACTHLGVKCFTIAHKAA